MMEIRKNTAQHRYEILEDGRVIGLASYRDEGRGIVQLPHTEIDPAYGGRGLGSQLVRYALDDIRDSGCRVDPACPFVAAYMDRHPEDAALRAP